MTSRISNYIFSSLICVEQIYFIEFDRIYSPLKNDSAKSMFLFLFETMSANLNDSLFIRSRSYYGSLCCEYFRSLRWSSIIKELGIPKFLFKFILLTSPHELWNFIQWLFSPPIPPNRSKYDYLSSALHSSQIFRTGIKAYPLFPVSGWVSGSY